MQFSTRSRILGASLALPFIFACNSATDVARHPVALSLRAIAPTAASFAAGASAAAPQITSLKLLVNQASLGNGDQFGCQDCQGNDGGNEADTETNDDANGVDKEDGSVGAVISVPLDGSAVDLATEQVAPGTYSQVEVEVGGTGATPGWPAGQTVEIQGTHNGTAFTIGVPVSGSFQQALSPPVVVAGATPSSIPVTITLPVATWFAANGTQLDPAVPAQLAQIVANIKATFSGPESGGSER
ncbi:MAG TPA: hypothetical protein VGO75_00285 [Gemmatimonadaceae bacterium]|nr:hypothetical protein [Gemmatimonadaceae bacterium]